MTSRKNNSNRTLGFQQLEDRRLMTATLISKLPPGGIIKLAPGNVTTSISSKHVLSITGDAFGDYLAITQTAPNEFTLTGLNGTTINKTHTVENFTGITGDVDVTFKGIAESLSIGNDSGITFANNLNVNMGNGANSFSMAHATVKGSMTLTGGAGNDTVSIQNATIGNGSTDGVANDLTIQLGGGQNNVSIGDFTTVQRDLNVLDPSSTLDTIYMGGTVNVGSYVYIVTGSGNDTVNLSGVFAGSQLNIQTGAGNDSVYLGGSNDWVGAGSLNIDVGTSAGTGANLVQFGSGGNGGVGIRGASTIRGEGVNDFYNDSSETALYDTIFEGNWN
jgi:hypothetical protein